MDDIKAIDMMNRIFQVRPDPYFKQMSETYEQEITTRTMFKGMAVKLGLKEGEEWKAVSSQRFWFVLNAARSLCSPVLHRRILLNGDTRMIPDAARVVTLSTRNYSAITTVIRMRRHLRSHKHRNSRSDRMCGITEGDSVREADVVSLLSAIESSS